MLQMLDVININVAALGLPLQCFGLKGFGDHLAFTMLAPKHVQKPHAGRVAIFACSSGLVQLRWSHIERLRVGPMQVQRYMRDCRSCGQQAPVVIAAAILLGFLARPYLKGIVALDRRWFRLGRPKEMLLAALPWLLLLCFLVSPMARRIPPHHDIQMHNCVLPIL